ncbi:MAG: GWxTD domain-containing protein [Ignavibacteria bacterium]|nr:GWxTD domain-containing protein [Ignavibacteria bacterium]
MEEYFRRVDQAYFAYRTLTNQNGALTVRGKVHILFGIPEEVERLLKPGEPAQEIWDYPSLKKTFTFVDRERNGNFRLQRP